MNKQIFFKLTLDFIMTALMLAAFAYQLTGNWAHEIIGVVIFLLLAAHNALNWRWYRSLLKGKYTVRRMFGTIVNLLLIIAIVITAHSGERLSRDLTFLGGGGFEARQLHMMATHWGLALISVHIGLHWNMILGAIRKMTGVTGKKRVRAALLRLVAIGFAAYGVKSSFDMSIGSKLLMQHTFGYWDFENAAAGFFFGYLSIMGLYIAVTYYALALLQKLRAKEGRKR